MRFNIKIFLIIVLILLSSIVFYFEFFRPFEIGLINFNGNLYEKDFHQNSFLLEFISTEDYKYSKDINFKINEYNIPCKVEALFSQSYGWYNSFYYRIVIEIKGEDSKKVIDYISKKYGNPRKTEDKYYWETDNGSLFLYYKNNIKDYNEISIETTIEQSFGFQLYIYIKKLILTLCPDSWLPEWIIEISPKL